MIYHFYTRYGLDALGKRKATANSRNAALNPLELDMIDGLMDCLTYLITHPWKSTIILKMVVPFEDDKLLLKEWWFGNQPIKNGGWTSRVSTPQNSALGSGNPPQNCPKDSRFLLLGM